MFKTLRDGERVSAHGCWLYVAAASDRRLGNNHFSHSQALLTDKHGRGMIVDGPQRVSVFRKSFQRLQRLSADQYEYIRVHKSSGELEHLPG